MAGQPMKARSLLAATLALSVLVSLTFNGPAFAAAEDGPPASLAIVETDPELSPLSSLLEVQLSRQGLSLVERSELDRILQEQELSAAGLVDRAALLTVGRLVRADAFLLLSLEVAPKEGDEPEGLLRVRLVETAHGVRLLDWFAAWRPDEAEEAAAGICETALGAISKLKLPPGELIPIGIVDIHRVQLGEEHQWVCRALTTMLSSRLSKEPRVVVLEREDLKLLMEEKQLTEGEEGRFWGSGVLIEGYVQRAAEDRLDIKLELRRSSGPQLHSLTERVRPDRLSEAVEKIAEATVREVADAPVLAAWEPEHEAEQFFRQGQLLKAHGRHQAALPLLETAHALVPGSLEYANELFSHVYFQHLIGHRLYTDRELVDLASQLTHLVRQHTDESPQFWDTIRRLSGYLMSPHSVATDRVRDINRENRRILAELHEQTPGALAERYPQLLSKLEGELALRRASTPEEGIANVKHAIQQFVMPPKQGEEPGSDDRACQTCKGLLDLFAPPIPLPPGGHLTDSDYTLQRELLRYFQELTETEDPIVRFFACLAVANMSYTLKDRVPLASSIDRVAYVNRALDVFEEHLQFSDKFSSRSQAQMRDQIKVVIGYSLRKEYPDKIVPVLERFWLPLIEKGDVDGLMLWRPGMQGIRLSLADYPRPYVSGCPAAAGRYVSMLERILALYEPRIGEKAESPVDAVATYARSARAAIDTVEEKFRAALQYLERNAPILEEEGKQEQAQSSRQLAAEIRTAFPRFAQAAGAPGVAVKMLLSSSDWPVRWDVNPGNYIFGRIQFQNGILWLALADNAPTSKVGLAGIDVQQGRSVALWQTIPPHNERRRWRWLKGLALGGERSYVAMRGVGLIEFPGTQARGKELLTAPHILTDKDGLPPSSITGIAGHGDKLWVGYGSRNEESGLGIYDPQTGEWETVFSSAVRGETVLEAGKTYEVQDLTPVAAGLLFLTGLGRLPRKWEGIWELDPITLEPEHVCYTGTPEARIISHGKDHLLVGIWSFGRFDPEQGRMELLLGGPVSKSDQSKSKWAVEDSPFVPQAVASSMNLGTYELGCIDLSTAAIHDGKLWARYGKNQLVILPRGQSLDEAQILANNILDGGKVLRFLSTPYGLVAIGEGSVGLIERSP